MDKIEKHNVSNQRIDIESNSADDQKTKLRMKIIRDFIKQQEPQIGEPSIMMSKLNQQKEMNK